MDRQVSEADEKLKTLTQQMKEKEQENRISKLKIKDLRRQLKHNQLQPLQQSATIDNAKSQSNVSQSMNQIPSGRPPMQQPSLSSSSKQKRSGVKPKAAAGGRMPQPENPLTMEDEEMIVNVRSPPSNVKKNVNKVGGAVF